MDDADLIRSDIAGYLENHQTKELLRFVTVGSVDDGKSTLIGRLLHDTDQVYEDQISAVKRATKAKDGPDEIDFSLFTDGLRAEREQGITIDVAYRYFTTAKRKFIIADTPGHVQYTRNMATGASTADVAIILIDARLGVLRQSRRHAYIASLLGIPHLLVAVNKMDLADYSREVYDAIVSDFRAFSKTLRFRDVTFLPVSALRGENVVERADTMPWYDGPALLEFLETVPINRDDQPDSFRFPVQTVLRPNLDYRGFAGQIASGSVKPGDSIVVLPSKKQSRVRAVDTFSGELPEAAAPMSVTLRLEDEIDISRGDMIVHPSDVPRVGKRFTAMVVWMNEKALDPDKSYFLKHTTQLTRVEIERVDHVVNLDTLELAPAKRLELNDIGQLGLRTHRPIFFDAYASHRSTGSFVLIDSISNDTVAAGMIAESPAPARDEESTESSHSQVSRLERRERLGQDGAVVWLTGLPGAGKTALAYTIERVLFDAGRPAVVVDPEDGVASPPARGAAPDHAPELAARLSAAGIVAVFSFASPERQQRAAVRSAVGEDRFVEIQVGAAEHPELTFEQPDRAALTIASGEDPESAARRVLAHLEQRSVFEPL